MISRIENLLHKLCVRLTAKLDAKVSGYVVEPSAMLKVTSSIPGHRASITRVCADMASSLDLNVPIYLRPLGAVRSLWKATHLSLERL
jgi:hypothetical protein